MDTLHNKLLLLILHMLPPLAYYQFIIAYDRAMQFGTSPVDHQTYKNKYFAVIKEGANEYTVRRDNGKKYGPSIEFISVYNFPEADIFLTGSKITYKICTNFRNGKFHGKLLKYVQIYNNSFQLIEDSDMFNGVHHGISIEYRHDGSKLRETTYVDGFLCGPCTSFYKNGKIWTSCYRIANKLDGPACTYDAYGNLHYKTMYNNGKNLGTFTYGVTKNVE
jgi:hypothetical protein